MGFFDFFRRKSTGNGSATGSNAVGLLPSSRFQHYCFAHVALRQYAFAQPFELLAGLADESRGLLTRLWDTVRETCDGMPPDGGEDLRVEDVRVRCTRLGRYACAAIEMPRPRAVAEAHCVAVLVPIDDASLARGVEPGDVRYFTLELGERMDGTPRTVLCDWTDDGTHRNYGDGPPPTVDAFLDRVRAAVE